MDLHRGGGFTQGRWIYTGTVNLHRGGGFTQGRWIYTGDGAADLHRGGGAVGRWIYIGAVGRWAVDLQSALCKSTAHRPTAPT